MYVPAASPLTTNAPCDPTGSVCVIPLPVSVMVARPIAAPSALVTVPWRTPVPITMTVGAANAPRAFEPNAAASIRAEVRNDRRAGHRQACGGREARVFMEASSSDDGEGTGERARAAAAREGLDEAG